MSTPPTVHDSDRKAAEEIHRIVARSFDVPNHVETSNSSTYLAIIIARHHAEERAAVEKVLEVALDALQCSQSVMHSHELQDSKWDGARDCVKVAKAATNAALTALRTASQ